MNMMDNGEWSFKVGCVSSSCSSIARRCEHKAAKGTALALLRHHKRYFVDGSVAAACVLPRF